MVRPSYETEIDVVKSIKFSVLSPEEIKKISVAEVTKTDTYAGTEPIMHGLFDPRMGCADRSSICQTCLQKSQSCTGHFGHINLATPIFYSQFFPFIQKTLRCVCFRCSKLLLNVQSDDVKPTLQLSPENRWDALRELCSNITRCGQKNPDGCGALQPKRYSSKPIMKIVMEFDGSKMDLQQEALTLELNSAEVHRIFKRITDKDAQILGFSGRPEWMICTVLPVPPPCVRPSVRTDTGQRSEDDTTRKLCDIVAHNNALRLKIEKNADKVQGDIAADMLQYHVATMVKNDIPGLKPDTQKSGRPLKSLTDRLKSKEGRIRGNLMGKRVNFSARSVISPDTSMSMDEIGVPVKIAMNMTFPEIVNRYNRDKLISCVKNGPDVYPGARFMSRRQAPLKSLNLRRMDRSGIELDTGDIVERHLVDGDFVYFNRQPTLHRMSMQTFRAKIMPGNTFRLNVLDVKPFNADYDGDEIEFVSNSQLL